MQDDTTPDVIPEADAAPSDSVSESVDDVDSGASLKQVLGALIFAAQHPLSLKELRTCLVDVAKEHGGLFNRFADIKEKEILVAIEEMMLEVDKVASGFLLSETATGFRFQSDASAGPWVRHMLGAGRANRLSRPSLETLAIIAYRQPVSRSDIEAVRGVSVDHVVKLLMEMQLVKIVGRSELPGKPFQYGTTQAFLEHFGLTEIDDLAKVDPALFAARAEAAQAKTPDLPIQPVAETAAEPVAPTKEEPTTPTSEPESAKTGVEPNTQAEDAENVP